MQDGTEHRVCPGGSSVIIIAVVHSYCCLLLLVLFSLGVVLGFQLKRGVEIPINFPSADFLFLVLKNIRVLRVCVQKYVIKTHDM